MKNILDGGNSMLQVQVQKLLVHSSNCKNEYESLLQGEAWCEERQACTSW